MASEGAQTMSNSAGALLDHLPASNSGATAWPDQCWNVALLPADPSPPLPLSSSDPDSPPPRPTSAPQLRPKPTGRPSKRKSRATKRTPTTYISADPANFRRMVQQVTGVWVSPPSPTAILKPEPHKLGGGRLVALPPPPPPLLQHNGGAYLLPALDTSAFLLGHQQGYGSGEAAGGFSELDHVFPSAFPTLESWGVI